MLQDNPFNVPVKCTYMAPKNAIYRRGLRGWAGWEISWSRHFIFLTTKTEFEEAGPQ